MTRTRFFGLADRGTAHIPCPQNLERTVRIGLACAAYETALEPLQVLRNILAVAVGLESARGLLNRQVPYRLGYRPSSNWSGLEELNLRPGAPEARESVGNSTRRNVS